MKNYTITIIIFIGVFFIGFFITREIKKSNPTLSDNIDLQSNTQIALIYIGCSTCPFATDGEIPNLINKLNLHLSQKSKT